MSRFRQTPQKHSRNKSVIRFECLENRCLLATWQPMGPAPVINGQVEKVTPNNEVSGAVHTVLAHPTDADVLYLGAANGGVWKTENATDLRPDWTSLIDDAPSLSIGAMAMDPNDASVIVAGAGRTSSFAEAGELFGLVLSRDAGDSWQLINHPLLVGKNISGLAIHGDTIVASAGGGNFDGRGFVFEPKPDGGIFRSLDGGATWESIEIIDRNPLFPDDPIGFEVFDLVTDPTNPGRLYAGAANLGVYLSENSGETWQNITNADQIISNSQAFINAVGLEENNLEMAVASNGRIYISLITVGQPFYIGFSDDQGGSWTQMDIPLTFELQTGQLRGLNPKRKPGGQGNIHFSITVDPNDPLTVYVGGDRQDGQFSLLTGNSLGARQFTGKLFRGDTRQATIGNVTVGVGFDPLGLLVPAYQFNVDAFGNFLPSPQWEHITHSNLIAEIPGGGTRRSSAPHADSREMTFDAQGELIEADDGGIYRRTLPNSNQGDWYSLNGDLQITEFHDIEYDSNSNILIGGTQDNGTLQQTEAGSLVWEIMPWIEQDIDFLVDRSATGDGGDVAVDDTSLPGFSYRYSSGPSLGGFKRQLYDAKNNLISETTLVSPFANFVAPVELNKVDPRRMAVGGSFSTFESFDRGNGFSPIPGPSITGGPGIAGIAQNAMEFGGFRNGVPNPDVLWVGSAGEVLIRSERNGELRLTQAQFPGGEVRDLALHGNDWRTGFVIDRDRIYKTSNLGDSWTDITGDLNLEGGGELRSVVFLPAKKGNPDQIVLGTESGAFKANVNDPDDWQELGDLPNAPVYDLVYDAKDDVLVAGTLGRGAFVLENASSGILPVFNNVVRGAKWNDLNGNGVRENNEPGVADVWVYVDLNGDNDISIGEPSNRTDINGNYVVRNVPSGTFAVREVTPVGWEQTFPANAENEHLLEFTGGAVNNVSFGNMIGSGLDSGFDYGNAPAPYPVATHGILNGLSLGSDVDGEFATSADDSNDGVKFNTEIFPGATVSVDVTISQDDVPPAILQAWVDFNRDGSWSSAGEQIFSNRIVSEGTNTLSFRIPEGAVLGNTFARFRYGYERGLGFSGHSFAGEVEDYELTIVSAGPDAQPDAFTVSENAGSQMLDVISNDAIRADVNARISRVSAGSAAGSIVISGDRQSIIYTPAADFSGTETFTYTLTDDNNLSDTATVSIDVISNLVQFSLQVTDAAGNPTSNLEVDQEFFLNGLVQDRRDDADGLFAAYMDVNFFADIADVIGDIDHGTIFTNSTSGDASEDGMIDEVGGTAGFEEDDPPITGTGSESVLLFQVPMLATGTGTLTFSSSAADIIPRHNVLLLGSDDPVPSDRIEFGSTAVTIRENTAGGGEVLVTNTNPENALDVNADNFVSAIDVLIIVNDLNGVPTASDYYVDVNADGFVTPSDVLKVVNHINRVNQLAAVAAAVEPESNELAFVQAPEDQVLVSFEQMRLKRRLDAAQALDAVFSEFNNNAKKPEASLDDAIWEEIV